MSLDHWLTDDEELPPDFMVVKPVQHEPQPLVYKNISDVYCGVSFDGEKFYTFKKENVLPYYWINKLDYIIEWTDNEVIRCLGYYDKSLKEIRFLYNRKIYKLYKQILKYQKLERLNQSLLISDKERKEREKMSLKEIEGIKSNRVDIEDIPKEIQPTKIETEVKKDPADKVECLYANFFWMQGKEEVTCTQKYRPFHAKVLLTRMNALGLKNVSEWVGHTWRLEKEPFGTLGYEKLLPVADE